MNYAAKTLMTMKKNITPWYNKLMMNWAMMKKSQTSRIVMAVVFSLAIMCFFYNRMKINTLTKSEMQLNKTMRKLWSNQVYYTNQYLISIIDHLQDSPVMYDRLLLNQSDLGKEISNLYGDETGNKISELLKEHVVTMKEVFKAAKTNKKLKFEEAIKIWYLNAENIATLLSESNPHWVREDLIKGFNEHLNQLTNQMIARINKKWFEYSTISDKILDNELQIADILTEGIVKQFPSRF